MRTLIVSVNAKYEHENPAPWYLKAACDARGEGCGQVDVLVGTINDPPGHLFGRVVAQAPDVVALSCYIWNRDIQLRLCGDLKAALPHVFVVIGGPEVSHADGGDAFLARGADVIVAGEGERRFADLLALLHRGERPDAPMLAAWRRIGPPLPAGALFSPCMPAYLADIGGRIAYVEASRGCPYRCSYCLSSESTGLTLLPLPQVFRDVAALLAAGARVIKFVDRTFNLTDERTLEIWHHLLAHREAGVTFHFEIAPDRLTEAQLRFLESAPSGLFQVEAGIQTVHGQTLQAISRVMDVDKALHALARLHAAGTVHVHADLIAGLPGETPEMFSDSFNRLYGARPHQLQLGFLKLLRGTRIRREAAQWGYVARTYAPYEVIATSTMAVADLLRLKEVEETVERFANSGRFLLTRQGLEGRFEPPFALFTALADQQKRSGTLGRAVSSEVLFGEMLAFVTVVSGRERRLPGELTRRGAPLAQPEGESALVQPEGEGEGVVALDLLRLDWVCAHRNPFLPEWLGDRESSEPAKTIDLMRAYGEQDLTKENPNQADSQRRNLRNRYHVRTVCLPGAVREGIRMGANPDVAAPGERRIRVIVDIRRVHPVLGRPEVICLNRCIP
jgi:radical SAM superfamily enzyme YgiQ (UPF0313 family)